MGESGTLAHLLVAPLTRYAQQLLVSILNNDHVREDEGHGELSKTMLTHRYHVRERMIRRTPELVIVVPRCRFAFLV